MTKTPRTDAKAFTIYREASSGELTGAIRVVPYDVCFQLETELADKDKQIAEARAEIDGLTLMATNASMEPARRLIQKNKELQAVIERMREALRLALPEARSTHVEQTILAALAAERGE